MTSVPLSDEQADRIEAGERPGAIGAPADLVEYDDDGRAGLLSDDGKTLRLGESVVTFTRPCPDCFDGLIRSQDDLRPHRRCGGSGRVPVTVPCPECHGRGLADVRGAPPCRGCGNGRARGLGRIPVEASVVHVIPTADVEWDRRIDYTPEWERGVDRWFVFEDLRWWVADLPWVLMVKWEGDGRRAMTDYPDEWLEGDGRRAMTDYPDEWLELAAEAIQTSPLMGRYPVPRAEPARQRELVVAVLDAVVPLVRQDERDRIDRQYILLDREGDGR